MHSIETTTRYSILTLLRNSLLTIALACAGTSYAQSTDDSQQTIRENPEIDDSDTCETNAGIPDYIRTDRNHIILNGSDWSHIIKKISGTDTASVSIVHIGDSHIQADFATGITRKLIQQAYGNPGRGLVTPLRMASTNEPRDYAIKSTGRWSGSKLLKRPWASAMGFTGVSIKSHTATNDLTVSTLTRDEPDNPFNRMVIYHTGPIGINSVKCEGDTIPYHLTIEPGLSVTITLDRPVTSATLNLTTKPSTAIYGISLLNGRDTGVLYHTIGNNGATYSTYNAIEGMGSGVSQLHPDLVVIEMGANEAFSTISTDELYSHIGTLTEDIRRHNPEATLLLVTPMECQKRKVTTIRRKGKKRRRVTTYSVNPRISAIRETILRYGADHNIAVYDFYDVAGGQGASEKWIADKLFAKDRIHHTRGGYELQGQLFYLALQKALVAD